MERHWADSLLLPFQIKALPLVIGYGCYGDSIEEDWLEGE